MSDDDALRAIANDGRAHLPPPLDEIGRFIRSYVVVNAEAVDFLALWTAHTWAFEAATSTPYVRVCSAERECGKSRLLEVVALLVRRSWLAVNPSAAVVFRKGDSDAPTLLLDEIDQMPFGDRRDLLSVLNAGYRIGMKVPRCTDKGELLEFDVYYPKAFGGIDDGKLPDTLYSRSVPVRLERRRPDEPIARFRYRDAEPAAEQLTKRLAAWAPANLEVLADAEPDLPNELGDREQEVWEPLLAIADLAGGDWPKRARAAAVKLAKTKSTLNESRGIRLLADIRTVFDARIDHPDRIFAADLVDALNGIEESGWGGWNDGKGMLQRNITAELARYPISPQKLRIGEATKSGYRRQQFEDAWTRYLPDKGAANDGPEDAPEGLLYGGNRTKGGLEPNVPFPSQTGPTSGVQDELDWNGGETDE
jgi:putative DNA primase/helicase